MWSSEHASPSAGKGIIRVVSLFWILLVLPWISFAQAGSIPLPGQGTSVPLPGMEEEKDGIDGPGMAEYFNLEWSGYLEDTASVEHFKYNNSEAAVNNAKARFNLSGDLSSNLSFGLSVVGEINRGDTEYLLTAYLPKDVEAMIPPEYRKEFVYKLKTEDLYLQEGFVTISFPKATLRAGRHKFYSGTGFAYNPIDLFNKKNPLDPTYETRGQDAVMLSVELSQLSELELAARTEDNYETVDGQVRLKYVWNGWDTALQYTHFTKQRIDWSGMGVEREFIWHLVGLEFSGEIAGIGIHGEGGYVFIDEPKDVGDLKQAGKDHERFLIGMDYTFENQLYLLAEYLRFGQGRDDKDDFTLNDRFAYITGEIITSNTDTLYLGARYPLTDLLDLSLYTIVNLNDQSVILNPWLEWDIFPNWKLSVAANIPAGHEDSGLGRMGVSGFTRLRYSF
jgi:hypothetical protein